MVRGEVEQRRSRPNFHDNFVISFPTIATIESRPLPPNKISKSIRERELRRKVRTQYQSLMAICWQQREWLFGFSFFFRASSVFIYERLKCTTCVEKNVTRIYFFLRASSMTGVDDKEMIYNFSRFIFFPPPPPPPHGRLGRMSSLFFSLRSYLICLFSS